MDTPMPWPLAFVLMGCLMVVMIAATVMIVHTVYQSIKPK